MVVAVLALCLVALVVCGVILLKAILRDESAPTPSGPSPLSATYQDLVYGAEDVVFRDHERAYYDRVFVQLENRQVGDGQVGNGQSGDGQTGDSQTEGSQTGRAQAVVTTPDLRLVLEDVFAALESGIDLDATAYQIRFQEEFIKAVTSHPERVTSRVEVELRQQGDQWKIIPNDDYDKAVTCDLARLYSEYYTTAVEDYVQRHR
ncbi:MAG: hypothetical protein LBJ62_01805 [Bifidobacteriaceae bacterium]|nr:hypothetical protein [Bifidobacteriaceae bacterium]